MTEDTRESNAIGSTDEMDTLLITSTSVDASRTSVSKKSYILIGLTALQYFSISAAFSIMAPFFPQEAEEKGLSKSDIGMVFGSFELAFMTTSPIFGSATPNCGVAFMFVAGSLVTGVVSILFSVLDRSAPGDTFFWLCVACRLVQASGCAAFSVAINAFMATEFPKNVAAIIGLLEVSSGLGYMLGPFVGGLLYEAGGFSLPFQVLGIVVILGTCICMPFLPYNDKPSENDAKPSYSKLLASKEMILLIICSFTCANMITFFDPTIAPFLERKFGFDQMKIGCMFLALSGPYTFSAVFVGSIVDKGYGKLVFLLGFTISGITLLVFQILNFESRTLEISATCACFALLGLSLACMYIPSFPLMLASASRITPGAELTTKSLVSGINQTAFSLGALTGPVIFGGFVFSEIGFENSTSLLAIWGLFVAILCVIYWGLSRRSNAYSSDQLSTEAATEDEGLISA